MIFILLTNTGDLLPLSIATKCDALSLHHSPTPLGNYLRRMKAKLGPRAATTATAHKIAVIFYTMVKTRSNMTNPSGLPETPTERSGWKSSSSGKPNSWATNSFPSNPRLHSELVHCKSSLEVDNLSWIFS